MKLNNKGFMLVEVMIASTILITTMVGLYAGFCRIYINYTQLSRYYSVDALYASKAMEDYLIDEFKMNNLVSDTTTEVRSLIENESCNTNSGYFDSEYEQNFCDNIKSQYNIKNMHFVNYDELTNNNTTNTNDIDGMSINETYKDYLKYLTTSLTNNPTYLIVTEIEDDKGNTYYGNLKVE